MIDFAVLNPNGPWRPREHIPTPDWFAAPPPHEAPSHATEDERALGASPVQVGRTSHGGAP